MDERAIEQWIRHRQHWTDAQLRTEIASKVKHCVDYRAAQELLDRREKARAAADREIEEARHREIVKGDRLARILGGAALLVAVYALPQVQRLLDPPQPQPTPELSAPVSRDDSSTDHTADTPAKSESPALPAKPGAPRSATKPAAAAPSTDKKPSQPAPK